MLDLPDLFRTHALAARGCERIATACCHHPFSSSALHPRLRGS